MNKTNDNRRFMGIERVNPPRLEEIGPDSIEVNQLYADIPREPAIDSRNRVLTSVSTEAVRMSRDIRAAFDEYAEGKRESFMRYFMLCPDFFEWDISKMDHLVANILTRSTHELFLQTFQDSDGDNTLLIEPKNIYTLPKTETDTHAVARSGDYVLTAQPHRHGDENENTCDSDVFAVRYGAMRESEYIDLEAAAQKEFQRPLQNTVDLVGLVATHSAVQA